MGDIQSIIIDFKDKLHILNTNIERLIERDIHQSKRIDAIEREVKDIKKEQQLHTMNLYKIIGFISCMEFVIPIILKFSGVSR